MACRGAVHRCIRCLGRGVSGADLPGEEIEWAKFTSLAWLKDDSGFFYSRYPAPAAAADADADGGKAGTETGANECAMVPSWL
jgi:hypothetical protein